MVFAALLLGGSLSISACHLSHDDGRDAGRPDTGDLREPDAAEGDGGPPGHGRVVSVAAGAFHTCAVTDDGRVWCWGGNDFGALGVDVERLSTTPVRVSEIDDAVQVAAGEHHSCARQGTGTVQCWGSTASGGSPFPGRVVGLTDALDIDAGPGFTCAVVSGGGVRCWGRNGSGQLGDGTTIDRASPSMVVGVDDAVGVSTGAEHACALHASGAISCWGANREARLGNGLGGAEPVVVPVDVLYIDDAVAVAAGGAHTCALRSGGELWCWGMNREGQAGSIPSTQVNVPRAVSGVLDAILLATGPGHTCFARAPGTVSCFGTNEWGQLGDGTGTRSHIPVPVAGDVRATALIAGDASGGIHGHSCALLSDGGVSCWGPNEQGQLGDGTSITALHPTRVVGFP